MIEIFGILGALFISSFLAGTILPLSSEVVLSSALALGASPWCALVICTLGNSLGSLTAYALGYWGQLEYLRKYCNAPKEKIERMQQKIYKYELPAAFLCFLPLIGDLIAVTLGFMRCQVVKFTLIMTLGKFIRYAVWIIIHLKIAENLIQ